MSVIKYTFNKVIFILPEPNIEGLCLAKTSAVPSPLQSSCRDGSWPATDIHLAVLGGLIIHKKTFTMSDTHEISNIAHNVCCDVIYQLKELICEPHTHVLKHGSPDKRVIPMVTFKMTGKNMLWFSQMKNNACITYSPDFNRCQERAVVITDLSLATLLKSTSFVHFYLTRNAFIKTQNRCVFFCIHIKRDFSDACFSFASAPGVS